MGLFEYRSLPSTAVEVRSDPFWRVTPWLGVLLERVEAEGQAHRFPSHNWRLAPDEIEGGRLELPLATNGITGTFRNCELSNGLKSPGLSASSLEAFLLPYSSGDDGATLEGRLYWQTVCQRFCLQGTLFTLLRVFEMLSSYLEPIAQRNI